MDSVRMAKQLWREKLKVALVLLIAAIAALLVSYRVSLVPPAVHERTLEVGAASSQILVDSPQSTLVNGATPEAFDTLAARAKVFGEYLSSLQARAQIAKLSGIPARSITTSGPFSPESGQVSYENQTSASRADELLQEGAANRLVFTAQDGVPIITVNAQAATGGEAVRLAQASFITLRRYVHGLQAPERNNGRNEGVTVRQLGSPEGGTVGESNGKFLMLIAFLTIAGIGCALVLVVPGLVQRWRNLDEEAPAEYQRQPDSGSSNGVSVNGVATPLPSAELSEARGAPVGPRR